MHETKGKTLFVCTKPYQYLLARLIKKGCGFDKCDLIILNHFYEAADFSRKVRDTGVWNNVLFIDDESLDQKKLKLNPIMKYFFYQSWSRYLPGTLSDISPYTEVFLAHDFVAVEYAIIRKFSSEGKRSTLYEEGFGNYINNSTHKSWHMKLLKRLAPWFGLPGGYFGSLKWINSVWLQRPELIVSDNKNPLRHKTRSLPMAFKDFLHDPGIMKECYAIYPELHEIDRWLNGKDTMTVVLTEPFVDEVADRGKYFAEIIAKVNLTIGSEDTLVFFKQHPGEQLPIEAISSQIMPLPKKLPIELLYLVITKNNIRKVNMFSFGSTAILNLYDLCKTNESLDIFIIESMGMSEDDKVISSRFCDLALQYNIQFQTL
ncbi:alpha-2,8-polysialyltransferase family protein [Cohnella silvisoli]|uniref:Alpha-2,8-polysialyltransferase family protein n=1 Tax=Cohnella silvisoli TaxID=2873699 RepID=A0ABV1KW83_9BACL|nr:alpha-2,8-polysialyltransferase family protein [Cohnella silvisoli]MCD9023660.1 alpha-2,8-polysialyltransferase family protein [Cohnella silvisoli]